jgi:hypothetical protein
VPIVELPGGPNDTPLPWVPNSALTCELGDAEATSAILAATEVFYVLSGRIYGLRQRSYRPNVCGDSCTCGTVWTGYEGTWHPSGVACSCASADLRLPLVNTVDAVFVDGELLSPDAYELYDRTKLVRVDGGSWVCCQHLSVNPDALTVVATAGTPVPEMGKLAVTEMACQIGALGTAACKLPTRVQTITRQGVSWTVLDPQDFLDNGRTGLYLGDLFLAAVNPAGVRNRVRVVSPDTPRISVPS